MNSSKKNPRMAEIVERIIYTMRSALKHPFGLVILGISITLWVMVRFLGIGDIGGWVTYLILLPGLIAYPASVIAVYLKPKEWSGPEIKELDSVRSFMESKLSELKATRGSPALIQILSEAISHLQRQIRPAIHQLLERQAELGSLLAQYQTGKLPPPEPAVLNRLTNIHARQRATIDECLQQASNAAAMLVAMLQHGDDESVSGQARMWASDLLALYDIIEKVNEESRPVKIPDDQPEERPHTAGVDNQPSNDTEDEQPSDALRPLVELALRRLNNPASLSECELIDRLPSVLASARSQSGEPTAADSTPLENAQALREALISSMDMLRPADDNGHSISSQALQYHILHEQYVLGRPIKTILVRHSIGEAMFHRNRRAAVSALARQLEAQEDQLAREAVFSRPPLTL